MRTRAGVIVIVLLLAFFTMLVSCNQQKTEWQGTIEEVDGVTYVRNPKEGLWDTEENAKVTIIQEGQIGELDGPEEFLFVSISDVTVNSKGDLYVADRRLNEIRKFNKDGEYLITIGRQGQGPGEFQSIRTISVNSYDDLIVFEGMLGRISIFSDNGEHIETTKKLLTDSWIAPSKIFVTDANYVFFGKLSNSFKLFHEFDWDWNILKSYIDYEFIDNQEFEDQMLGALPGNCIFLHDGDVLYTRYFYDNQIFGYKNKKLVKIISRESDIKKPYEIQVFHDVKKAMDIKDPQYDFKSFGQGKAFIGKTYQCSIGLYQLSNGHIVNFLYLRRTKNLLEFGVELYDSEGRFLKYSKLGENLNYNIRCMDSSDLFYAIDRKEYNKVIMFRLGY